MDVKTVIIWVCVGGAGLLIMAEVIAYLRLAWQGVKALQDGSESLSRIAGAQLSLASSLVPGSAQLTAEAAQEVAVTLSEGPQKIADATALLDKIVDLLKTLGAKVPLLVGAIVLLLLAAFLAGVITVSASVGTENTGTSPTQSSDG